MKIKSVRPMLVTPAANIEKILGDYEVLGFRQKHYKDTIEGSTAKDYVLENEDGYEVDIVSSGIIQKDMMALRINVDNFEEAVALFKSRGYHIATGKTQTTSSSKSCMMIAPSGSAVSVIEHLI